MHISIVFITSFFWFLTSCSENDTTPLQRSMTPSPPSAATPVTYKYLALGDSYTIGASVCETCRFPEQLKTRLQNNIANATIDLRIIAQSGWTTTNLKNAIAQQAPASDYDLVTLLIGVNNQYQDKPFSLYEQEFPELLETAIALANGDLNNVIVVSIPDYRYTPFGNGLLDPETVSVEIDAYNDFARDYCLQRQIEFVDITDITRNGLQNPTLVAQDGLHPSQIAYSEFVIRLLPKAISILTN